MLNHLVYAIRVLRKSPGFTLSALAILTLGIGANTAIFGIVDAVLLHPLPFPKAESVVTIFHVPPPQSFPGMKTFAVSAANYVDWRQQSTLFDSMAVVGGRRFRLGGGSRPQSVSTTMTVPDFFRAVGVHPVAGRAFTVEECEPGRDRVIVLSDGFARSQFGSSEQALSKTLLLNGANYKVIGVMPASFQLKSWFPTSTDAWAPLAWTPEQRAVRGNHNFQVVARMRPGVATEQAQKQLTVISDRLARQYPEEDKGWGAVVIPLREFLVGDVRPALLALLGAVGFVLLIACANTANLVLARTITRRKELAIRAALGASASQVRLPVLVETTLLALTGGALGLLIAQSAQSLVMRALAEQMPRATDVELNGRVLAFTLVSSLVTGLASGLVASWRLMRTELNQTLKQGSGKTDAAASGKRTRDVLVVAEVALSLILLVGAGLMVRSLWALRAVNPGFRPANVMTMTVPIPQATDHSRFYEEFLAQVRALPGVAAAGAIDNLPMQGGSQQPIVVEGRPAEVFALQPNVSVRVTTPGYLATMGIPLLAGRDLREEDTVGKSGAVLISQAMAKQFWPDENAVGKHFRISFTPEILREVVGVTGDVKERGVDVLDAVSILYEPLRKDAGGTASLVVRTHGPSAGLVPAITRVLQQINPELPIRDVMPLEELMAKSLSQQRFSMFLFVALAALAFLLAAVGIYSVISYSVRGRVQEIGIRMALGAQVRDVLGLVVLEGMRPTLIGVAIGTLGAYALGGVLSRLIFGVSATDAPTFAAVALLLGLVALFACAIPAYRATKIDPVGALRSE